MIVSVTAMAVDIVPPDGPGVDPQTAVAATVLPVESVVDLSNAAAVTPRPRAATPTMSATASVGEKIMPEALAMVSEKRSGGMKNSTGHLGDKDIIGIAMTNARVQEGEGGRRKRLTVRGSLEKNYDIRGPVSEIRNPNTKVSE